MRQEDSRMRALQMAIPSADSRATGVVEVDEPIPGPREVSINVAFAGVNFIDIMARRGDPGYATGWPYVPGLEVAGTVRAVGAGVGEHKAGDRVAAFTAGGGLAQVAIAPAALTVEIPAAVSLEAAAAAPLMLSTAVLLLENVVRLRPGESVTMHSAGGGVGSAVPQVAAALGGGVRVGTVGSPARAPGALAAGWDHIVPNDASAASAIRKLLPGGVDVILDPAGTQNLDLDLSIAAPGARVVLFGNPSGGTPAALPPLGRLIGGNVGILGFSVSNLSRTRPTAVGGSLRRGLSLLADGGVRLEVTVVHGLEDIRGVHDLMAARRGSGKYVAQIA
jgi:NADPH2:quinone reductase